MGSTLGKFIARVWLFSLNKWPPLTHHNYRFTFFIKPTACVQRLNRQSSAFSLCLRTFGLRYDVISFLVQRFLLANSKYDVSLTSLPSITLRSIVQYSSFMIKHCLSLCHSRPNFDYEGLELLHILKVASDLETILQVVHDIIGYQCKARLIS